MREERRLSTLDETDVRQPSIKNKQLSELLNQQTDGISSPDNFDKIKWKAGQLEERAR